MNEFYDVREAMQFAFDQVVRGMSRQGWRRSATKYGVNVWKLTTGEMCPMAHLMGENQASLEAVDPSADNVTGQDLSAAIPKLMSILQPWVNDPVFDKLMVRLVQAHDTGAVFDNFKAQLFQARDTRDTRDDCARFYLVKMAFNLSWPEDVEWPS